MKSILGVLLVSIVSAGRSAAAPSAIIDGSASRGHQSTSPGAQSTSDPTPGGSAAVTAQPSWAAAVTLSTEDAGLRLDVMLDRLDVEAGGAVTAHLTLHNGRAAAVTFAEPCRYDSMVVQVPTPVEPIGRKWTGISGAFKRYALEHSQGTPMESSIREPMDSYVSSAPCQALGSGLASLEAGGTYDNVLTWTDDVVAGLPCGPGQMPFAIRVQHDLQCPAAATPMPSQTGPAGSYGGTGSYGGICTVDTLEVKGKITVRPGGPAAISAGMAIDSVLGDARFAAWLTKQPRRTWANVNLFLQPGANAAPPLPEVPYWDVELFDSLRTWAILYVDARDGHVLGRDFCNVPCDR